MNTLTLAVAGGRKTQSIADHCKDAPAGRRILVMTYTQYNQQEITHRLAQLRPLAARVDIGGWFSFLLHHWVRPYLPLTYPGQRLYGLNFDGDPGKFAKGQRRFLDAQGRAYKLHLAKLALDTNSASNGAVIDRLAHIYDEVWIDEVQDLNGYDLEILSSLFESRINVHLVGDIRQALIHTNVRDPKHKQYKGISIGRWFALEESKGRLSITRQSTTWRCNQIIARFADDIFPAHWEFPATVSMNNETTDHDGVFALSEEHVDTYVSLYNPLCLRYNTNSGKGFQHLPFINFGVAKGMGVERVLIYPTKRIVDFLVKSKPLEERQCCSFYVAVTRARSSAVVVSAEPHKLGLPIWTPESLKARAETPLARSAADSVRA